MPVGRRCDLAPIAGQRAEKKVWEWVIGQLADPTLILKALEDGSDQGRQQQERDQADLRSLVSLQVDLDREENKLIELFTNDAISLAKFKERNSAVEDQRMGIEQSILEIEGRKCARLQAQADIVAAGELIRNVQAGLPALGDIRPTDEKRALLGALQVKATAQADGNIYVTCVISQDLLTLAPLGNCGQSKDTHAHLLCQRLREPIWCPLARCWSTSSGGGSGRTWRSTTRGTRSGGSVATSTFPGWSS